MTAFKPILLGVLGALLGTPLAAAWSLDAGLTASMGAARFATEPAPNATGLFASADSHDGGATTGLSGAVGLAFTLAQSRGFCLTAEGLLDGTDQVSDVTYHYSGSSDLHQETHWSRNGGRADLLAGWAWPLNPGAKLVYAPQLKLGGWYEAGGSRTRSVSLDGGSAQAFAWADAPPDDAGWIVDLGLDMRSRQAGGWWPRACLDLRWRQGHAQTDPAAGGGAALQVFEAVLTLPAYVKGWN